MRNQEQILASDPAHSVWVSASAGTGKTKVLTDRVLRLLLEDVPFDKILCLTFTNAAATEMTNRISAACLDWQSNTDSLSDILGRDPSAKEIICAKSLFSRLMLSPRQLSIHTIHSFCQKILQSFPFEAGLQPGFKVISEIESDDIIDHVVKDLASAGLESIIYLLQNLHENTFLDLVREILSDQIYFYELFQQFPTAREYEDFLRSKMDVEGADEMSLRAVLGTTLQSHQFMHQFKGDCNDSKASRNDSNDYDIKKLLSFFLTASGAPKKKLLTKKESDASPDLEQKLREIQGVVYQTDQKCKRLRMIFAMTHIYEVAKFAIEKYNFYKKHKGYLDYDDLIYRAKELLTNSDMKDWVLYKLDGGVMHLLIDEAQDTSPEQWQIIEAIMSEFYSGSTSVDSNRTIFIVGDDKQSIYSFQGADVGNFNRFNDYIRKQMIDASKSYKDVELKWSYRSGSAILDVVSKLWGMNGNADISLRPFREIVGTVELWPLYNEPKDELKLFWPLLDEMKTEEDTTKLLARDIAKYIRSYIASGRVLPSTGKPAIAEDFMILVRRRGEFMEEVIKALKDENVDVGGMDRMVLTDHISVQDILSLAKYALMPRDELNLAELLKSPIIGMSEDELRQFRVSKKSEGELILDASRNGVNLSDFATSNTLFDFFYHLIEVVGLRAILASSNGTSTHDVLDELLNLVMQFEKSHSSSLQEFIYWIERKDMEVKRDPYALGLVRVMTIHGSKGLQSPIVILADTTSLPSRQNQLLWEEGMCLWLGGVLNSNEQYKNIKSAAEDVDYLEYLRLLYVALTRAEDHLIIAGASARDAVPEGCFYDLVSRAMRAIGCNEDAGKKWFGEKVVIDDAEFVASDRSKVSLRGAEGDVAIPVTSKEIVMLNFSFLAMMPTISDNIHASASQSPLNSRVSLNYGQLIHKILEDSVNTNNFAFSPSHPMIRALPQDAQTIIVEKLSKLFVMEEFVELIKNAKIQTEVSIGYNDGDTPRIGRIDLLAIRNKEVIIVDYKTDKKVPKSASEIPENYLKQLKFYADAIGKIYPQYKIHTKILWIEELVLHQTQVN